MRRLWCWIFGHQMDELEEICLRCWWIDSRLMRARWLWEENTRWDRENEPGAIRGTGRWNARGVTRES